MTMQRPLPQRLSLMLKWGQLTSICTRSENMAWGCISLHCPGFFIYLKREQQNILAGVFFILANCSGRAHTLTTPDSLLPKCPVRIQCIAWVWEVHFSWLSTASEANSAVLGGCQSFRRWISLAEVSHRHVDCMGCSPSQKLIKLPASWSVRHKQAKPQLPPP